MVSPMVTVSRPAMATTSPAEAIGTEVRFKPS
jgi:hypothetical protein